jgi:hypothetical protein
MVIRVASCPGCGAEVKFDLRASMATVCAHCGSVVGRSDRGVESLGKVADLAETSSGLAVGMTGRSGLDFRIVGRAQLKASSGALWNEWYLSFAAGKPAWLADVRGDFFLSTPRALPAGVPRLETLAVGQEVRGEGIPEGMTVSEVGRATLISAEGELPYLPSVGREHSFVDMSGPEGRFATIDYGQNPPVFFLGKRRTLSQLGLDVPIAMEVQKRVVSTTVSCPNCGGALPLRAPDRTERVGCTYCGALLDATKGKVALLGTLNPPKDACFRPEIEIGATGELGGVVWTVIGFLVRQMESEGQTYSWQEYLLHNRNSGFGWLVCASDRSWTRVEAVDAGSVEKRGGGVRFGGRAFSLTEEYVARVAHVSGEVFWRVEVGETVRVRDYKAMSGRTLSAEETVGAAGVTEVNWSFGEPMSPAALEKAFSLKTKLRRKAFFVPDESSDSSPQIPAPLALVIIILLVVFFFWAAMREGSSGFGSRGWGSGGGFSFGGK